MVEKSVPRLEMDLNICVEKRNALKKPSVTIPTITMLIGIVVIFTFDFFIGALLFVVGTIWAFITGMSQAKYERELAALEKDIHKLREEIVLAKERMNELG